jgi:hypothetical protein
MAIVKLIFENLINVSAGVGDAVYAVSPGVTSVGANNLVGIIDSIPNNKQIDVDDTTGSITVSPDDFIMFQKNNQVNISSLNGYYAQVRFENTSSNKAELFSIGSEVSLSSK